MSGNTSAISITKQSAPSAERHGVGRGEKAPRSYFRSSAVAGCLAALVILGVVLIRTVNLGADAPKGLPAEEDYGIYVDEGYKTLSARNLVVFGAPRWHRGDDYHGWLSTSPVTQGAFYLAFSRFGQTIKTARMVSIIWFALFVIAFGIAYSAERCSFVLWTGLLMLGFQYVLWVISRTAIFEIAILSLVYSSLLLLRRFSKSVITYAVVIAVVGVLVTFGVKRNSFTIVAPALFGIVAIWAFQKGRVKQLVILLLIATGMLLLLSSLRKMGFSLPLGIPLERINLFAPAKAIHRFLVNPLLEADPFLVILLHASAVSILLYQPRFFENNPYRASMASIAFLGTAALATVPNIHLRYCTLVLPAFVLLFLEWWIEQRQNPSHSPQRAKQRLSRFAAMIVVFVLIFDLVFLVGWSLSSLVGSHGLAEHAALKLPVAAALAVLFWKKRNVFLSKRVLHASLFGTLAVFALFNTYKITSFLTTPTWQVRTISDELVRSLPQGATIAGDWVPLFAIGTSLPVLYTNNVFNRPERFKDLRPSHFFFCDTIPAKVMKDRLEQLDGVKLGAPLLQSQYNGVAVTLYPLHYTHQNSPPLGTQRIIPK